MSGDIQQLKLTHVIEVENYRTEYPIEHITGIADSIRQSGFKQEFAITVYPIDVYSILDKQPCYAINTGHCRTRAARMAGLTVIPAIIKPNDPITLALDQVGENGNRRDPNDIDTAHGYKRTLDTGATIEQLSKAVGKNRQYIEKRIALLSLIPDVQELVAKKHMGIDFANLLPGLDVNFQRLAVKQYRDMHGPTIDEFRQVVSQLLEKQNTLSLFDLALFSGKPDEIILADLRIERKKSRQELEAELEAERKAHQIDREFAKAKVAQMLKRIALLESQIALKKVS